MRHKMYFLPRQGPSSQHQSSFLNRGTAMLSISTLYPHASIVIDQLSGSTGPLSLFLYCLYIYLISCIIFTKIAVHPWPSDITPVSHCYKSDYETNVEQACLPLALCHSSDTCPVDKPARLQCPPVALCHYSGSSISLLVLHPSYTTQPQYTDLRQC